MGATRVLVVDDERFLADLVATALGYEGYETAVAGTGRQALETIDRWAPHLVVLDVGLPDVDGWETCRRLRERGHRLPVLFLTARDTAADTVHGLRLGGDDHVAKPFDLDELAARIEALLRRNRASDGDRLVVDDLEIDVAAHEVRRAGQRIDLTPTEFALLRLLVAHTGRVLTKRRILEQVWEFDAGGGSDGVVATYVSYLRRKLDGLGPPLIHTVPRVGYVVRSARSPS